VVAVEFNEQLPGIVGQIGRAGVGSVAHSSSYKVLGTFWAVSAWRRDRAECDRYLIAQG
jgi:hypothetical protein